MGEEGEPQGVVRAGSVRRRRARGVKVGRWERPVPPIMAIWIGPRRCHRKHQCD